MCKNIKITISVLVVLAALISMIVIKNSNSKTLGNSSTKMPNRLIVGVSADYPPFEYFKDGKLSGFDIDLARGIASHMKRNIEFKDMDFSLLVPSLYSLKVDFIISSITMNQKRKDKLDFSQPYYTASLAIITQQNKNIKSIKNLPNSSRIGVQTGSVMEGFIKCYNQSRNNNLEIVSLSNNFILMQKLKIGEVDAIIVENSQAHKFIESNHNLEYNRIDDNHCIYRSEGGYVIGVRKGSDVLRHGIDSAIDQMKADGQIEALIEKWNLNKLTVY